MSGSRLPARMILLLAAVASPALHAQVLRWDRTEATIDPAPMVDPVETTYTFTNTTDSPITIAHVHSSCGCTVPQLEKNTYGPGESGTIRAVFTIGERSGVQEKTIIVTTAAPHTSSTTLLLRVNIPKLFEVSPYFVVWQQDEDAGTKAIDLRLLDTDALEVASVESRHATFAAELAPVDDMPGHFRVRITPSTTSQPTNGAILVTLRTPQGQTRAVSLYAMVRQRAR